MDLHWLVPAFQNELSCSTFDYSLRTELHFRDKLFIFAVCLQDSFAFDSFGVFCWVLCPRLSQQSLLRMGWRTCGQTWPPSLFCSHGTESRPRQIPWKCVFFNWRALVLTSGWTHSLDFHLFFFSFFCILAGFVSWNQSDSAWNARSLWYVLKSSQALFLFLLVRPRLSSGSLTDLWFLFCVLHYIFFLYMNQTRPSHTFVCINATPRQHTDFRIYKEHVSIH